MREDGSSHAPARILSKAERQRLIATLVQRKRIGSQIELRDALAAAGCRVTQATISRDVRELGLEKTHDPLGRPRYVPSQRARQGSPKEALAAVLRQFGRRAEAAANLVVLVSELGTAPAIARSLDLMEHPLVVGTLAGDDTVLVVARSPADAQRVARELGDLMAG
jgi:transcriptional regulator of arginine metabolism